MPSPANTPRFRLQQVCDICEVSERRLRSWLDRKQIALDADSERKEGTTAHRRFSAFDLVRIGTVSRLVDYGAPIAEANRLAKEMLDGMIGLDGMASWRNTPVDAIFAALNCHKVVVWCNPNVGHMPTTWQWERYSDKRADGEVAAVRINFETLGEVLKNGINIYASEGSD
ncbi:MAG: MerR family transcriptional regulator [Rhodospirillales bacterium]